MLRGGKRRCSFFGRPCEHVTKPPVADRLRLCEARRAAQSVSRFALSRGGSAKLLADRPVAGAESFTESIKQGRHWQCPGSSVSSVRFHSIKLMNAAAVQ